MNAIGRNLVSGIVLGCVACGVDAAQSTVGWPVYNGGPDADHYSALAQINRSNVQQLKIAWSFDSGEKGNLEDNPLIVERTLYAYTPTGKVVALNAATGKLQWKFDPGIDSRQPTRGVAYWTDGRGGRIFAGVLNFLYCLDAQTGRPITSFGELGRIDLRKNLRGDFRLQSIALTTPGIIYKDLIIVGGRDPETHPAPPGDIRAYDVRTGDLVWTFHTIPHPGEPGYVTWPSGASETAGAANNWAGMSLDVRRGIVYVPTGSAVFDFYGGDRVGNDLYADTLLALDANTGKRIWSFQDVHHDIWDRDLPAQPALYTVQHNGKTIEAVAQITKQSYVYLFDRLTGEPLFPIREFPYPASNVPGEVSSPTQPKPDKPAPFARQHLTEDMLTTRTPESHAWAVKTFRTFRSDGQFVPFSLDKQTVVFPGYDGGGEWSGAAIDPVTDVLYVGSTELAWTGGLTVSRQGGSLGEQAYQRQCAVCHGLDRAGEHPEFPSLVGVLNRLSPQQVTETVQHGKGRMPSFPNIGDSTLASLIEFLRTDPLRKSAPGEGKELAAVPELNGAAQPPPQKHGAAVYQDRCAICHGDRMEGIQPAFPALIGLGSRFTALQTVELLKNGKGRMPAFPDLNDPDLESLLQYLGVDDGGSQKSPAQSGQEQYIFTGYRSFLDPDGYPAIAPPWGTLNAIDLKTGNYLWKIPLGEYPALAKQGITNTGSELYGGPIVTAGGIVFIGATVFDRKFHAFDSRNGKLLWQTELPFAGVATPSTYMVNGRQYVVIAASGGRDPKGPTGAMYIAFALSK